MRAVIRAGQVSDIPALQVIERRATVLLRGHCAHAVFLPHLLDREALLEGISTARLWVAETDAEPVGYALGGEVDGDFHLLQMDVDPSHGRRGIGRRLLETVCEAARASGYRAVLLTTLSDVPWNAPFYASAGFREWPVSEWGPGIRKAMEQERKLGFPMSLRVVMRRLLSL